MKSHRLLARVGLGLMVLLGSAFQVRAAVTVRLSVKFILNSDGASPSGNISTVAGFSNEVARGNQILIDTGRACKLQVIEFLNIQPSAPAGTNADYWFNLPARANRATFEAAALADPATWRWNGAALNMFVNNSSSGQCAFVGGGSSISFGGSVGDGVVLHETGHFFNLRHTHAGDLDCTNLPPFLAADGDSLAATINDHNCLTRDGLSMASFGANYDALMPGQQAAVDSSWLNVMSYHQADQLLGSQMDIWAQNANGARLFSCSGRTWFVAIGGSDGASGDNAGSPFATFSKGLSNVGGGDDVILLRAGNYSTPVGGLLNTPCTLSATRGPAFIGTP
jgi:hypothetical protein